MLNDLFKFRIIRLDLKTIRRDVVILDSKFRATFSDHLVRSPYGISEKILAHNDESLTFHGLETFRGSGGVYSSATRCSQDSSIFYYSK